MKKVAVVLAGLVAAVACVSAEPRMVVLVPDFDFGYMPQNATVQHRYWFHSLGDDTVKIENIKTGCACAVMPYERDWIAPGDSLPVTITWKLGRSMGGVSKFPRVFTNAGPDPVTLQLRGTVLQSLESTGPVCPQPYRFELGRSALKDIDSLSFVLANFSDQDLSVSIISALPDQVDLVMPRNVPGGDQAQGHVRLKPEYADTEFETSITLGISDAKNTHVTIPIRRKFYVRQVESQEANETTR